LVTTAPQAAWLFFEYCRKKRGQLTACVDMFGQREAIALLFFNHSQ